MTNYSELSSDTEELRSLEDALSNLHICEEGNGCHIEKFDAHNTTQYRCRRRRESLELFLARYTPKVTDKSVGDPTKSSRELEEILKLIDRYSIHKPKGQAKGTLARKELKKRIEKLHTIQTTKLQAEVYKVGDVVTNVSGWGVGSDSKTPLKVKSILLQVEWEGAKSTRWLSSKEVEHLEREYKIGEDRDHSL